MIVLSLAFAASFVSAALPELPDAPFAHDAAVVGGKLYVVGGYSPRMGRETASCRRFDGSTWTDCAPASSAKASAGVVEFNGRLWRLGGLTPNFDSSVESLDPAADRWRRETTLPEPLVGMGVFALGGKLYVIGGQAPHEDFSNRVHVYDPATKRWSRRASMQHARKAFAGAVIGGKIYAAGGVTNTTFGDSEVYDPKTDRWRPIVPMLTARGTVAAATDGAKLYVAGGSDNRSFTNIFEVYDPSKNQWSALPPAPEGRDATAGVFWRGCFVMVGGRGRDPGTSDKVLAFDPRSGAWNRGDCAPALVQTPKKRKERPDDFALVVGVEKYRALPAAEYAEADAALMAERLQALGVPEENVVLLTGEKAGRADFEKYLDEWLPRNLGPKSRLYVYFSGHGAPEPSDGTAFLMPWDGDASFLRSTGYPVAKFLEKLSKLPAREIIVALDACFSGAGGRSVIAKGLRPLVVVRDPAKDAPGRLIVFSSAAADQVSGGDEKSGHGLFTEYFARGLDGEADADKNGMLTVAELDVFVRRNVARAARRQNREQTTQLRASDPSVRLY